MAFCKHNGGGPETCPACKREGSKSASLAGCVAVPVEELRKLEQARVDLYEYLCDHLDEQVLLSLVDITSQIWRVANRKKWD